MMILKRFISVLALLAVAACGGGSGDVSGDSPFGGSGSDGGGGDGGGTPTTPVAADLSLALSATSLANNGTSTITATVTAVDSNRNALPLIPVTISVNSNAVASVSGPVTDTNGAVTAAIGIGADRSNRVVTVTAVSGSLSQSATFEVTGASLTSTPLPAVIAVGAAGQIDFRLIDSNANPMSGQAIVINGVGGVETSGTTGSNGEFSYQYTAPSANFEVRATAGGVTKTQAVLVQAGVGTIPDATVAVQSASLAASPSVVPVNTGNTSNRSELRALFIGAGNVPVKNVRVRFDLAGDLNGIGGSLTSSTNIVYSDVNGVATTAYVPGSRFSPTDGLTVRACWSASDFAQGACPNQATATLTVIAEPLSVSIGTNALLEIGPTGLDYIKKYLVQVNDSSGLAKAGVEVSPSIDLQRYFKGEWLLTGVGTEKRWVKSERATCDNEDLNRNGVLEVYGNGAIEDANGTGSLEPRKADVNISFVGSSTTNTDGQVVLKITYPQSLGSWVGFNILVAASGVAGTEGRTNYRGILPVLASAVNDAAVPPAFVLSPYGVEASPTVLTENPEKQSGLLCTNSK